MKQRLPTPEECALWLENNRHTAPARDTLIPNVDVAVVAESQAAATVAAPLFFPLKKAAAKPTNPAPLIILSERKAARRIAAGSIDATLDLHGMTRLTACAQVQAFLQDQVRRRHRHVLIITGKGRGGEAGVLRSSLPHWLNEPPLRSLISAMAAARPEKGGAGALHVLLKLLP